MRFKNRVIVSFLIALLLLPGIRATTLVRLSLDQLAAGSDAVARVRFVRAESRWENGSIWTVTTFDVLEILKGQLPGEIEVRLPGGRVGHLTSTVDGTPRFYSGSEAIVFLQRSPAAGFTVAGWVQGSFRISRDPRTGNETVTQDSGSFAVFDAPTRTFRTEGIRQMTIEEFRARFAAAGACGVPGTGLRGRRRVAPGRGFAAGRPRAGRAVPAAHRGAFGSERAFRETR